jgi:hypothetical protein
MWAKIVAALIVVIPKRRFDCNEKSSITHTFNARGAR